MVVDKSYNQLQHEADGSYSESYGVLTHNAGLNLKM
jgi:hypothetical protein